MGRDYKDGEYQAAISRSCGPRQGKGITSFEGMVVWLFSIVSSYKSDIFGQSR